VRSPSCSSTSLYCTPQYKTARYVEGNSIDMGRRGVPGHQGQNRGSVTARATTGTPGLRGGCPGCPLPLAGAPGAPPPPAREGAAIDNRGGGYQGSKGRTWGKGHLWPQGTPQGGGRGGREGPHTLGGPLVPPSPQRVKSRVGRGSFGLGAAGLLGCRICGWQPWQRPRHSPGWCGGRDEGPHTPGGPAWCLPAPDASSRA